MVRMTIKTQDEALDNIFQNHTVLIDLELPEKDGHFMALYIHLAYNNSNKSFIDLWRKERWRSL